MRSVSQGQRPLARFTAPAYLCAVLKRPRLEDRLRDAIRRRAATLITAPAGYGKSCLVASVTKELEAAGARLVWIAMDASDNSYDRLIHALDRAFRSGPGWTSAPDLAAVPSRGGAYSYLIDLLEDLSDPASPFILVLDDYEVVEEQAVHALVEGLIRQFVPHVHIVLLSRTMPPLALSSLRHRHQLCEISATDLAFSRDEIVDLIREGFHQDLAADNLQVIEARTEGWPVAVQLVGTALTQQRDAHAFITELSGRDSDVADFLNAEVLARLPPDLFDFLLRISPLTRVSHGLCAAVTGVADAAIMLDRIVRSNLLLFPLDRNNIWFRLHPLFRDYLLGQMALRPEVSRDDVLKRAMRWCEEHGLPEDAINYALELDDQADAARLLMHHAEHFVYTTGEHAQFLAWMKRLKTYPDHCSFDLKYWQAWALIISLRKAEAEAALHELDLLLAASPVEDRNRVRIARREIIHILICIFSDQINDCVTEASEWLNNFPDADPFDISSMATSLAVTTMSTGEFAAGRSALQTARFAAIAAGSPYAESWVGIAEGGIALSTGDFRRARTVLTRQFKAATQRLGHASSAASTIGLLLAQACYELGELDEAARYLKFGLPHITDHGVVEAAVAGFRVMIRGKARQEGFEAALDACYECEGLRRDYGPRLALMLLNEYVWLTLRHGRVDKAVEATGFDGSTFRNACLAVREGQWEVYDLVSALIRARVLIATSNADAALRIITGALAVAARSGRRAIKVELLVLRCRAEVAAGKQQRAHRTLLEALTEAMPLGMVQMFVDEGPALQSTLNAVMPMLMQLPDIDAAFVETVQPIPPSAPDTGGENDDIAAGEVFSRREIQILKLLESGLTNEAVAERLFLSLKTVKWYLYTIYPKLGAKNRTGALAKARKLGLL